MKAVHGNIDGPLALDEDIALYGRISGGATVRSGKRFILHGTIAGDLRVEKVARAIVRGTVAGRIYNDGGRVELFGIADAVASSSHEAVTIINPAAHILGGGNHRSVEPRRSGAKHSPLLRRRFGKRFFD